VGEVLEVRAGELQGLFGDEHVGEGGFDGEQGLAGGVFELGLGLRGGSLGVVDAPAALLAAFEEAR
jgi:hypothetical protein